MLNFQIDHVELYVPDRYEAAAWYKRVLECEVLEDFEFWAKHSGGPLMISPDGGKTKLALFTGEPQGARPTAGFHRVAFGVSGEAFLNFVERLASLALKGDNDEEVTEAALADHGKAYSLYFCDPFGHRLEITTYDYEVVRQDRDQS